MKLFFRHAILIFSIICIVFISLWMIFLQLPIVSENFYYVLQSGTSVKQLANDLHEKTHLKFPILFRMLVKSRFDEHRLQAGEYLFPAGSTSDDVLNLLTAGKILQYEFTLVNGWNYAQVMQALQKAPRIRQTLMQDSPKTVAKKLGLAYSTPEGLLFPETYFYTHKTTDLEILKRATTDMQNYLKNAWEKRDKQLGYKNSYQALIVASMIEKETSLDKEKPIIAAIILKRLQKGIPLQIDPTVIYGLGKQFKGNLTKRNMKINTPYNTYLHYGLPPTPIAMPSTSSIDAALHPAKTDYLYFVAKGDGSHVFSKTLKEQDRAIKQYQLKRRKR